MGKNFSRGRSNINAAVWLIGLGILWLTDTWWPGILILIGISLLVQAPLGQAARPENPPPSQPAREPEAAEPPADDAWEKETETSETPTFVKEAPPAGAAPLPVECPACGGPVAENAHKVEWAGPHTAYCPFCSTKLDL